jgi:hypothetical protein
MRPAYACLWAWLMTSGCLLYTDRINSKPSVHLVAPAGVLLRGQTVSIAANASDPDGDPLQFAWYAVPGDCGAAPDAASAIATSTSPPPFSFQLPADPTATYCVSVVVTDRYGAPATDALAITAGNHPPLAVIDVQVPSAQNVFGRYKLYSSFRLSRARSSDPDGDDITAATWALVQFPPGFPDPSLRPCAPASPPDLAVCLDVGAYAGTYVVSLVVDDGVALSAPADVTLTVDPDLLPCIGQTRPPVTASPLVMDPGETKTFSVAVIDDGSPYPRPVEQAQYTPPLFTWSLSANGGPWRAADGYDGLEALTLAPGPYVSGDVVDVRVTVSDGVPHDAGAVCDPACGTPCAASATWRVQYR